MSKGRDSPDSAASRVLNAFSPIEASCIVGLSVHMLNYLVRHCYLVPHYVGSPMYRVEARGSFSMATPHDRPLVAGVVVEGPHDDVLDVVEPQRL